jgi:serine/threonine protein kinase
VHRDLKPANVLLQVDSGRRAAGFADDDIASFRLSVLVPKVSDFGLAKLPLSDITASQTVMGTPAYMSPEQARGEAKFVGPPADVWALGVILYESLTGERPFRGDTAYEVFARVLADHPRPLRELNSEIPEDLELICLRCLEKNPAQRYSTADELAADLGWFLRNEPISARPVEGQEPVAHAPPARAVTARSLAARAFVSRVLKARRAKRHLRRFWAEVVEEAPSKPKPQRRLWAQIARSKPLPTASHSRRTAVAVRIVLATGLFVAGIVLGTAAHRRSLQETAPDHPAATERAPVRAEGVRQTVAPPPAVPVTTPAQNPIQFHTTRPQLEP